MTTATGPGPSPVPAAFAGLEWLKLLACLGIVVFHQHAPGERLGYAGLPVFTMLTAAMATRSARGSNWRTFRATRLRRLLLPWFVWSAFYAVVQIVLASMGNQPLWSWLDPSMLVMGTYPHLWYLPFAAVTALAVGRFGHGGQSWQWLAAGAASLPICSWLITTQPPLPVPQWLFVLPGAVLGVALARAPLGQPSAALLTFVAAAALGGAAAWLTRPNALLLQYAIAVPATALAWSLPMRLGPWTKRLASSTFGIYVLHPFVGMLLALAAVTYAVPFTVWSLLAGTFGISLSLTLLLRETPMRAYL